MGFVPRELNNTVHKATGPFQPFGRSDGQKKRRNSTPSPHNGGPKKKTVSRTHKQVVQDAKDGKELKSQTRPVISYDERGSVVVDETDPTDRNSTKLRNEVVPSTREWTVHVFVESYMNSPTQVH